MPHIVAEYSDNLHAAIAEAELLIHLRQTVIDSGLFSPGAVKARGISYDHYVLPEEAENFIHICVSILDGRSTEQREKLSQSVFRAVKEILPQAEKVSVDIHEMKAQTYRK